MNSFIVNILSCDVSMDSINVEILKVISFIFQLIKIVYFIIPMVLIVMTTVDISKNVIANDEGQMKKNVNLAMKRIISCVFLFLVEVVVRAGMSLLGNTGIEYLNYLACANKDSIYAVSVTQLNNKISKAKANDSSISIDELRSLASSLEDGDEKENYLIQIDEIEQKRKKEDKASDNTSEDKSSVVVANANDEVRNNAENTVKILLIGNSGTYVNGYGQVLKNMAKATNKKIVVVMATCGGQKCTGSGLTTYKLNYKCWSANTSSCSGMSGSSLLKNVVKKDFAKLNRTNWDYIFLQNHYAGKSTCKITSDDGKIIYNGDKSVYNVVKDYIVSSKRFTLNLTTYGHSTCGGEERIKYHYNAMKDVQGSLMLSEYIQTQYPDYDNVLYLSSSDGHQSVKGAYLFACIAYAKIYGTSELAKSNDDTNFIKVYDNDAKSNYKSQTGKGNSKYGADYVNQSDAKKIQALVSKNYTKYVLYY